jgi:hypothetical protein
LELSPLGDPVEFRKQCPELANHEVIDQRLPSRRSQSNFDATVICGEAFVLKELQRTALIGSVRSAAGWIGARAGATVDPSALDAAFRPRDGQGSDKYCATLGNIEQKSILFILSFNNSFFFPRLQETRCSTLNFKSHRSQ